ncbi:MAG: hypothetical protein ABJM58_11905 [Alteripontixanthobacter sp.]
MPISLFAALLQVGPAPSLPPSPSAVPPELSELRERQQAEQREREDGSAAQLIAECRDQALRDGVAAETDAQSWLAVARGGERAAAQHCLGLALANQGKWQDAAEAFDAAHGHAADAPAHYRAQLLALAGNARLALGENQRALDLLDAADAQGARTLEGEIAIDRARALVALDRAGDAAQALARAREIAPDNALGWLLSATLSRRMDDLAGAQQQIERAAALDPEDPAIGLEAGVIAALLGQDEAAKGSWQSVIALAPESSQADAAQAYLAQLDAE